MKHTSLAVAVLAVALAGCSAESDERPSHQTSAPAVHTIPSPTSEQGQALARRLNEVVPLVPSLDVDATDKIVSNARNLCDSYLGGSKNLVASTKVRFTGGFEIDEISDEQAQKIIDVVTSEPWCR